MIKNASTSIFPYNCDIRYPYQFKPMLPMKRSRREASVLLFIYFLFLAISVGGYRP